MMKIPTTVIFRIPVKISYKVSSKHLLFSHTVNAHLFLLNLKPWETVDMSFLTISQGVSSNQRWFESSRITLVSIMVKNCLDQTSGHSKRNGQALSGNWVYLSYFSYHHVGYLLYLTVSTSRPCNFQSLLVDIISNFEFFQRAWPANDWRHYGPYFDLTQWHNFCWNFFEITCRTDGFFSSLHCSYFESNDHQT